jgi:mannose-6-phosphate isomerase-like protein (cupin superfamily)
MQKINVTEELTSIKEYWTPKIIGDLNEDHVILAKLKGEFFWHKHDNEDEMFFILRGNLIIKFEDKDLHLSKGDVAIIPKGVLHLPIAEEEVHIMLIEPKGTKSVPFVK